MPALIQQNEALIDANEAVEYFHSMKGCEGRRERLRINNLC